MLEPWRYAIPYPVLDFAVEYRLMYLKVTQLFYGDATFDCSRDIEQQTKRQSEQVSLSMTRLCYQRKEFHNKISSIGQMILTGFVIDDYQRWSLLG